MGRISSLFHVHEEVRDMFRKPFRLDNSDKNCPYIVIRSEKQTNREGKKYLLRIKSPWDYDEVFDDEHDGHADDDNHE